MNLIKVRATDGVMFPMEHNARKYITSEVMEVENSAYYRRAIRDGDLLLVTDEPEATPQPEAATGEEAETAPESAAREKKTRKTGASDE